MSEKRKPELVFIAEYWGINTSTRKRLAKIELFPASQWDESVPVFGKGKSTGMSWRDTRGDVYRIRINGKWWKPPNNKQTMTLSEFFSLYRKSLKQWRTKERRKQESLNGQTKQHATNRTPQQGKA
jgi:hypothetical protein